MAGPTVSVILSACNDAAHVSACVLSVLDQNFRSWELVAVDRGSRDETHEILQSFAKDDPRVRVHLARGATCGGAWNAGLERSNGTYILFIEAADLLTIDGLASLVNAASAGAPGASFGGYERRGLMDESLGQGPASTADAIGIDELLDHKPFPAHAQLIARQTLGHDRFREELKSAADVELWLRLARRGVRWRSAKSTVAVQRLRPLASPVECKLHAAEALRVYAMAAEGMEREGASCGCRAAQSFSLVYATFALAASAAPDVNRLAKILLASPGSLSAAIDEVSSASGGGRAPADWGAVWDVVPAPLGFAPARWWQRGGFCGRIPRSFVDHVGSGLAGIVGSEERTVHTIVDGLDARRPVVLLGLGKNARRIARVMTERGMRVRGRDDALDGPPGWAAEDRVPVEVISKAEPWDHTAQHVMTVLHDEEFMKRIPEGTSVVRWREAIAKIAREKDEWAAAWAA